MVERPSGPFRPSICQNSQPRARDKSVTFNHGGVCLELFAVEAVNMYRDSETGADWGRKAALAYMDETAHFWVCPRDTHIQLREGGSRFEKFLENDLPNGEKSHISDDLIHLQNDL